MINIAEKLKDCPKGTKLYSPMCGEVELDRINMGNHIFPIIVRVLDNKAPYINETFTAEGKWCNTKQSECLLFPSKDNRDWNKFDYRIKPEPKYRPFANAQECLEEMQKHQPFGWIKDKNDGHYSMVTTVDAAAGEGKKHIGISGGNIWTLSETMCDYTFADGEPFGINEDL